MMALKSTEEAITEGVKESYIPIILAAANNSLQHYPFVYVLWMLIVDVHKVLMFKLQGKKHELKM